MVAVCAAIPAMAEFKAEFNTAEATAINITEAGSAVCTTNFSLRPTCRLS